MGCYTNYQTSRSRPTDVSQLPGLGPQRCNNGLNKSILGVGWLSIALCLPGPVELIAAQVDCERLAYPTGAEIFASGHQAAAIFAVQQGLVELIDRGGNRLSYRPGEVFSYQDIAWREGRYRNDAVARTPVQLVKLSRLQFLNLLHNHPTLAVMLISQQHERMRKQRNSGTICY